MAQKTTDAQLREHLDRYFPFIEQGAERPGRWVPYENGQPGRRWSGQMGWRTRHGDAVVRWDAGKPNYIENASLADGARVNVIFNLGSPSPFRYKVSEHPRRWIHGTVDIRPDGVTFTPGEQPRFDPPAPTETTNIEADLARDQALRDRLVDAEFADAFYAYLENEQFWKEDGEHIWQYGQRSAARFVAGLRGHGDTYLDYFPHGGQKPVTEAMRNARRQYGWAEPSPEEAALNEKRFIWFAEIPELLNRHGWRKATPEDRLAAANFASRDLSQWESRPASSTPEWAAKLKRPAERVVLQSRNESTSVLDDPHFRQEIKELMEKHSRNEGPPAIAEYGTGSVINRTITEGRRLRQQIQDMQLSLRLLNLAVTGRISEEEYRSGDARIRTILML